MRYAVRLLLVAVPGCIANNPADNHVTFFTVKVKVKFSHYRPGVAQRVGRGIALLFHDRGTRRG